MKISEIMHRITMVESDMSVSAVAKLMSARNIGSVLTKKDDCIMIVTERDILNKAVALDKDLKKTGISEIMTECVHTIDHDSDISEVSSILTKNHIRRLPVTERGKIVGIVTARDVAKSLTYLNLKAGITRKYAQRPYR